MWGTAVGRTRRGLAGELTAARRGSWQIRGSTAYLSKGLGGLKAECPGVQEGSRRGALGLQRGRAAQGTHSNKGGE